MLSCIAVMNSLHRVCVEPEFELRWRLEINHTKDSIDEQDENKACEYLTGHCLSDFTSG